MIESIDIRVSGVHLLCTPEGIEQALGYGLSSDPWREDGLHELCSRAGRASIGGFTLPSCRRAATGPSPEPHRRRGSDVPPGPIVPATSQRRRWLRTGPVALRHRVRRSRRRSAEARRWSKSARKPGLAAADLDDLSAGPVLDLPDQRAISGGSMCSPPRFGATSSSSTGSTTRRVGCRGRQRLATLALVPWLTDLVDAVTIPSTAIAA